MATTTQVIVTVPAATSSPLTGSAISTTTASVAFSPQLGRDMYLTLTGTWAGSVQIQRSTNAGGSWNNITKDGGKQWGYYTFNCDEAVDQPTDGAAIYRLQFKITSGSVTYRLGQ